MSFEVLLYTKGCCLAPSLRDLLSRSRPSQALGKDSTRGHSTGSKLKGLGSMGVGMEARLWGCRVEGLSVVGCRVWV